MRRVATAFAVSACLILSGGLAGCSSAPRDTDVASEVTTTPVNVICPIGGHTIPADAQKVVYKGETIAFCCNGCYEAWQDMTPAERNETLATALSGQTEEAGS